MKESTINEFKKNYFKANIEKTTEYISNPDLIKYLKSGKEEVYYLFLTKHPDLLNLILDKVKWTKDEFNKQFGFSNIYEMFIKKDNLDNFLVISKYYKNTPTHLGSYPSLIYSLQEKSHKISEHFFKQHSLQEIINLARYVDIYQKLNNSPLKDLFLNRILKEKVKIPIVELIELATEHQEVNMSFINEYLLNNPHVDKEYKHSVFTLFVNNAQFHLLNNIDSELVHDSFHGLKLNQSFKSYKHLKKINDLKIFIKSYPHVAQFADSFYLYDKDDTNLFFQLFKKNTKKITIEHKLDFIRQVLFQHLDNEKEVREIIEKCNKIRNNFVDDEVYKRLFTEHLLSHQNATHLIESSKVLKHFIDTLALEHKKELMHSIFDKIIDSYPLKSNHNTNIKQKEFKLKMLDYLIEIYPDILQLNSKFEDKPYVLKALKMDSTDLFKVMLKHNNELETPTFSKSKLLTLLNKHNNPEFKIMYEKILLEKNIVPDEVLVSDTRKKLKI